MLCLAAYLNLAAIFGTLTGTIGFVSCFDRNKLNLVILSVSFSLNTDTPNEKCIY